MATRPSGHPSATCRLGIQGIADLAQQQRDRRERAEPETGRGQVHHLAPWLNRAQRPRCRSGMPDEAHNRELAASAATTAAYSCLLLAAILRPLAEAIPEAHHLVLLLSASRR